MGKQNFKLNLKKFELKKIPNGSTVLMIGRRGAGKSHIVKSLFYEKRDIPIGVVMSGTESANHFYSDIMPNLFIHDEFDEDVIKNLVKRQNKIINKYDDEVARYGYSNINYWAFIVFDDLMFDTSWVKNIHVKKLFMNGRHHKLLYIVTMQYPLGISPPLRENTDYVFILRNPKISIRKKIYEHYAGMFPTFDSFSQVMDACTEDYNCLVIDNTTKSNNIEDMVYWFKAGDVPSFKVGAPTFWQYHSQNYDDKDEEEEDENINQLETKKNAPQIHVNRY